MNRLWGIYLTILFQCARLVFAVTKTPMRGALVAVWHRGRVLLVQKSYHHAWSIPGGLVKKGETWEQAAVRETFEEVGLRLECQDLEFIAEVPGYLGPNDRAHLFEINLEGPIDVAADVVIDGREIVGAKFISPKEALEHVVSRQIEGYLTACLLNKSDISTRKKREI